MKCATPSYELKIRDLEDQYQEKLKDSKNRSMDGSRAVIKGKLAEQLAPMLPDFVYSPSDARFIGDPIDYIIFDGYTELKDRKGNADKLEIVLVDIKTGKASLSSLQEAIAEAANNGRIRFEVIRPKIDNAKDYQPADKEVGKDSGKGYSVPEIRKDYPNAYQAWTDGDDEKLVKLYQSGKMIAEIASEFGRNTGAIRARLKKLGQVE